jgi:hypothetical protein
VPVPKVLFQVNTAITTLNLESTSLSADAIIAFATVLENNNTLKTWIISNNIFHTNNLTQSIFRDCMVHIARMLRLNCTLQELGFGRLGINDALLLDLLASAIHSNVSIHTIDLSRSNISCAVYCGIQVE